MGSSDCPPVAFLHGLSSSRDTWKEVAATLSAEYQVWTLDFRGHGHSDRTASYDLAGYLADARALIKTIGRPTVIAGHSHGDCIAGILAHVRGTLVEDPPWYFGKPSEWGKATISKLFSIVGAVVFV